MATSSKVQFSLDRLRAAALATIDAEIVRKTEEVNTYGGPEALDEEMRVWRGKQEEKIQALAWKIQSGDEISDEVIARFRIDPVPTEDRYERTRAERELRHLLAKRDQINAKTVSLVANEDGSVSLTKTQMKEFFGI